MTTEYTDHFRLNLPDFRSGPWHDLVNQDFVQIDALLMSLYQGVDTQNWDNNVHYLPGTTAIDPSDNTFWVAIVDHTSAPSGTFAEDRTANPTYWNRVVVGIAPRGEWANNTHYLPNDMVSDSIEHVIAVAKDEHTSNASGTIRDDGAHWTFIADIGSAAAVAASVSYDNTVSGSAYIQLQGTTDDLYSKAASSAATLADHSTRIGGLETSVGTHSSQIAANASATSANTGAIATNTADITALESSDSSQNSRLTALESHPGGIADAPSDGVTYARKNVAWIDVLSVAGASVLVSDSPPSSPRDGQLWWESDTGSLYIYYNDGNTTQWVVAVPQLDGGAFVAKSGDTMTGPLVLAGNPSSALQATPKQYVDAQVFKKNYIVNGAMMISQENGNTAGTVTGYYPADMFNCAFSNAGAVSFQQVSSATPGGSPNRIRMTVTAADASVGAADTSLIISRIEGLRMADLRYGSVAAKTITLQFGVKAPAGTYSVVIQNGLSNRSYAAEYVIAAGEANTDVIKSVTFPGDTTGTWAADNSAGAYIYWSLMCGTTNAVAPNTWIAGNAVGSTNQFNFMGTNGNIFELFDVGLYQGSVTPSFQVPDYASELIACQRYYYKHPSSNLLSGILGPIIVYQAALAVGIFSYPQMRAAPVISFSGASTFLIVAAGTTWVPSGIAYGNATQVAAELDLTVSGMTSGSSGWLRCNNTSCMLVANARL